LILVCIKNSFYAPSTSEQNLAVAVGFAGPGPNHKKNKFLFKKLKFKIRKIENKRRGEKKKERKKVK
jgi:hypothetical protein